MTTDEQAAAVIADAQAFREASRAAEQSRVKYMDGLSRLVAQRPDDGLITRVAVSIGVTPQAVSGALKRWRAGSA